MNPPHGARTTLSLDGIAPALRGGAMSLILAAALAGCGEERPPQPQSAQTALALPAPEPSAPVQQRPAIAPLPEPGMAAPAALPGGEGNPAASGRTSTVDHGGKRSADPYAYPLGPLPKGFFINRPSRPQIVREAEVRSAADFAREAQQSGTRLRVHTDIPMSMTVRGSDIEVLVDRGVRIDSLTIAKGSQRVRISGGKYRFIALQLPNGGRMGSNFGDRDFVQDVMIDGVDIDSNTPTQPAIGMYGRRVAIVDSHIRAATYAIWGAGPSPGTGLDPVEIQDLIVARCTLESRGRSRTGDGNVQGVIYNEATVRLVHINRSAIVDSYVQNTIDGFVPVPEGSNTKANYRIHGKSDQNLFARNVLVNSGTQFANTDDDLGAFYFNDNVFYHSSPDLFNPHKGNVRYVEAHGNVVYTRGQQNCLGCAFKRPDWKLDTNEFRPFKTPPKPPAR
jgi:hypothetical protein